MKKLFALLLAGLLVASFAACKNNPAVLVLRRLHLPKRRESML